MTTPLDIAVENIWAAPIDFSSPYQPLDLRSWLDRLSDELRHPLPNEKDEGRSRKLIKEWVEERIRVRDGTMHPHVGVPPNLYKLQDSTSLLDDLLEMALGDTDEWPEDWVGQLPSKAITIRYFLSRWKGEVRAYSLERCSRVSSYFSYMYCLTSLVYTCKSSSFTMIVHYELLL